MNEQDPPRTPTETSADAGDQRQMHLALGIVFIVLGGSSFTLYEGALRLVGLPFLVIGLAYLAMAMKAATSADDEPADPPTPAPPEGDDR